MSSKSKLITAIILLAVGAGLVPTASITIAIINFDLDDIIYTLTLLYLNVFLKYAPYKLRQICYFTHLPEYLNN